MSAKVATATPRDEMPFSNSDEGCAFTANWCDRCVHDKPARRNDPGNGCGVLLVAICGQTPGEWIEQEWGEKGPPIDRYHCIEFRDENEPPPPRTEPLPTPPGQGELIPVEPYVGTRMFSDVVGEIQPQETS